MSSKQKIAKSKRMTMVLLGLMSAILLFIQQPLNQIVENDGNAAIQQQMPDDGHEAPEESYQVMAYEVLLVPIMSFNLFHSFDLLIELPTLENTGSELMERTMLVFDSYIKNLFNRIIAPNAP